MSNATLDGNGIAMADYQYVTNQMSQQNLITVTGHGPCDGTAGPRPVGDGFRRVHFHPWRLCSELHHRQLHQCWHRQTGY